jgi:hypothetical protein
MACLMLVIASGGCVNMLFSERYSNPAPPAAYDDALLSGELVFGEVVSADEYPDIDVLAVDSDMQAFVDEYVVQHRLSVSRLHQLLMTLDDQGYFDGTYEALNTQSALDTFHTKRGNCLSYTSMFIALARASGLQAYYQIVKVPPTWNATSGMLIRNNHINASLRGARYSKNMSHEFTVDFNQLQPPDEYQRSIVSDLYATSLFYANVSMEALRRGENRKGFVYLKKAIEIVPGNVDLWINLGAFYGRNGKRQPAVDTFHVALQLDNGNRMAMSGLSRGYAGLGQAELAQKYERSVRAHRERNAYYHFAMAQLAYEHANYLGTLDALDEALNIRRHNARFYFLKSLAERELGREEDARRSLSRARRYGDSFEDLRRLYAPDLAVLDG